MRLFLFWCCASGAAVAGQSLQFGDWVATSTFAHSRASHAGGAHQGRLYVLGGYFYEPDNFIRFKDVQLATIQPDGSLSSWRETAAFSIERSGLGVAFHGGFVYLVGGDGPNGSLGDVQYALLAPDGSIERWQTSPHRLNTPRSNHVCLVATQANGISYLYTVAGVGQKGKNTVHFDTVEFAPLAADGTPGPWKTCDFHLKGGRSAPGVFLAKDRLYVLGGWGDLLIEDVFEDVQYAGFQSDGQLQPWHTSPYRLKMPLYGHVALALPGGRAVVVGGNAGEGNYFNNIQEADLVARGGTGNFTFSRSQMPVPRWGHSGVFSGGNIYILGGAAKSGFLNSVVYAPVSSDER